MAQQKAVEMPIEDAEDVVDELPPGTKLLKGQYTITRYLNSGGFGITYLAKDSLDRDVVIKECFPSAFSRRSKTMVAARSRAHATELRSVVQLFVKEARNLSKIVHPNIVAVHQVFEDNGTAYMALDFVDGLDLQQIIDGQGVMPTVPEIVVLVEKLLHAIGFIHANDMLHRDISPDNVLIAKSGEPVLIDFGAAREQASKSNRAMSALRVVKDGYSPQEFYIAGSEQGPWSDLYALGATLFHLIAGEAPVNGQARLAALAENRPDPCVPLDGRFEGYPPGFLAAIDKALSTMPKQRVQSATEWLAMFSDNTTISASSGRIVKSKEPAPDLVHDRARAERIAATLAADAGSFGAPPQFARTTSQAQGTATPAEAAPTQAKPGIGTAQILAGIAVTLAVVGAAIVSMQGDDTPQASEIAAAAEAPAPSTAAPAAPQAGAPAETASAALPAPAATDTPAAPKADAPAETATTAAPEPAATDAPTAPQAGASSEAATKAAPEPAATDATTAPQAGAPAETASAALPAPAATDTPAAPKADAPAETATTAAPEPAATDATAAPQAGASSEAATTAAPEPAANDATATAPVTAASVSATGTEAVASSPEPEASAAPAPVTTEPEVVAEAEAAVAPTEPTAPLAVAEAESASATEAAATSTNAVEPAPAAETEVAAAPAFPAPEGVLRANQVSFAVWDIKLPFVEDNRIIDGQRTAVVKGLLPGFDIAEAGTWLAPGVFIYTVNGNDVQLTGSVATSVLNSMKVDPDGMARVVVEYAGADQQREVGLMTVPATRLISLGNGLNLEIRTVDGQWQTIVAGVTRPETTSLRQGDVIYRDRTTGTALETPEALETILAALVEQGVRVTTVSVLRDNRIQDAAMQLAAD